MAGPVGRAPRHLSFPWPGLRQEAANLWEQLSRAVAIVMMMGG